MPRVRNKPASAEAPVHRTLQEAKEGRGQFLSGLPPFAALQSVFDNLGEAERQALFTINPEDLYKQALKKTKEDIFRAKERHAAMQALWEENKQRGRGPKCDCGDQYCTLELEMKQLEATALEQHAETVKRLKQNGIYKIWRFSKDSPEFLDPQSFRKYLEEHLVKEELRQQLPRKGTALELAAQHKMAKDMAAAYKATAKGTEDIKHWLDQLNDIIRHLPAIGETGREEGELRYQIHNGSMDVLELLMKELGKAPQSLMEFHMLAMAQYVHFVLAPQQRPAGTEVDLCWADLHKMHNTDIYRMAFWLSRRIQYLYSGLAEAQLEIDPLTEDQAELKPQNIEALVGAGTNDGAMSLNPQWMRYLQAQHDDAQAENWKDPDAKASDTTGAQLAWIFEKYEPKFETAFPHIKLAEMPSPEKALKSLEMGLWKRQFLQQELADAKRLVTGLQLLAQRTDAMCSQYDIRPLACAQNQTPQTDLALDMKHYEAYAALVEDTFSFLNSTQSHVSRPKQSTAAGPSAASGVVDNRTEAAADGACQPDQSSTPQQAKVVPDNHAEAAADSACQKDQSDTPQVKVTGDATSGNSSDSSHLSDQVLLALLRREELITYAQAYLLNQQLRGLKDSLANLQRHLTQWTPEYLRRKAQMDATEKLKRDIRKNGYPGPVKARGCRSGSCDNLLCAAAEVIQQELPFMDFAAARELVKEEHMYKSYEMQVQATSDSITKEKAAEKRAEQSLRQCIAKSKFLQGMAHDLWMPALDDSGKQAIIDKHFAATASSKAHPAETQNNVNLPGKEEDFPSDVSPDMFSTAELKDALARIELEREQTKQQRRQQFAKGIYGKLTPRRAAQKVQQALMDFVPVCEEAQASERAALIQLEAQLIDAACDDPGLTVTYELMLPLIRQRLLAKVAGAEQSSRQGAVESSEETQTAAQTVSSELAAVEEQQSIRSGAKKAKKLRQKARKQQK